MSLLRTTAPIFWGNIIFIASSSTSRMKKMLSNHPRGWNLLYIPGQGLYRFLTHFRENRDLKSYLFNKFNEKYHLQAIKTY